MLGTASDLEQTAGSLVVSLDSLDTGLSLNNLANTNGSVSADLSASCTSPLGARTVQVLVNDGFASVSGTTSIDVTANTAPTLGTYPSATATTSGSTTVTPLSVPTDNGSVVTLTAAAPGFTGSFSGNPSTGKIYRPD